MKKIIFEGAATALVTPMNNDGSVNYTALENLVEEQINNGIDALVICGTTGESSTLDHEEHVKVLEVATKKANKRVPIIAGTGSNDTNYAVKLCNDAEKVGVDAFLMVTPYYNKTSQHGLVAHYTYIADRVNKPIILYNVPSRTGVNIKPETYKALSAHPNIVATKEANGDIESVKKTIELCGEDLWVYSGNDDQIIDIVALGGKGVISVLSNIVPNDTHKIVAKYNDGDKEGAKALANKYSELVRTLFVDVNPVPVKEAMNMLGYDCGPLRLPLVPMLDNTKAELKKALKDLDLLK